MNPLDYIHSESVRQSATVAEMAGMCNAYQFLIGLSKMPMVIDETLILRLSLFITGNGGYRRVPVFFRSGGHAMNWVSVPRAMERLVETVNDIDEVDPNDREDFIDALVKEFLDIHPFVDGNGRVASLLRNYLLGTLSDPTPLPYYFGES